MLYLSRCLCLGPQPVGVQCPLISSLGEFPGIGTGSGILGHGSCWCPSPFPFALHISVSFSIHSSHDKNRGVNSGRLGGRDPPDFGQEWVAGVSWTGLEILLYLIMYRTYMYVRKL